MTSVIPVVLFAYARPEHLKRVLACLMENSVPLIYAFVDGPKMPEVEPRVREVRDILRQVDWCEIHITEEETNLGLGTSILTGVGEIFRKHDMLIVFEDDLICVPGTYQYLCAALEHYKDDHTVMSVTGWTHPRVTPSTVTDQPYFDGRTESWSWGTYARAWKGMEPDALSLLRECEARNIDIYRYGADLPEMAKIEGKKNIWAVRFAYLHILNGGLCLRPPHSMVNNIGFDAQGTNTQGASNLSLEILEPCPQTPRDWPPAVENPECPEIWQSGFGRRPKLSTLTRKLVAKVSNLYSHIYPRPLETLRSRKSK